MPYKDATGKRRWHEEEVMTAKIFSEGKDGNTYSIAIQKREVAAEGGGRKNKRKREE